MRHPFLRTLAGSGVTTDPNFENVTLLLHGDGTNGGQNNTFVDGSTNNFTITRNGNTTQGTFSPYGDNWSNYFDGTGDYLTVTYTTANFDWWTTGSDFTVEAWVYANSWTNWSVFDSPRLVGNMDPTGGTNGWSFGPDTTGKLRFYYYTGTGRTVISSATLATSQWNHIAMTKTSSGITLFINGTAETTTAIVGTPQSYTAQPLTIGSWYSTSITGYVSNLRIVRGTAVYSGNFTVPTSPLTAVSNTKYLTCQSNRFRDTSSNNLTITRNGDVRVHRFSPFSPTAAYAAGTIGGSGYFDGTGDYLSVAGSTAFNSTGDFTMEAWIYLNARSAYGGIISFSDSSLANGGRITILNTGYLEYAIGNVFYTSTLAPLSEWAHVAMVRSGSASNNVSCYFNGTRVGQFTSTAQVNRTSNVCAIGRYYADGTNQYWINGYISDPRYVVGTAVYSGTTITVPSAPLTAITNTSLLLNFQNAAILDNAMMAVPETVGNAQIDTTTKKFGTGSLEFDGTDDRLSMPSSADLVLGTGNFTIECWVQFNDSINRGLFQLSSTAGGLQPNTTTNLAVGRGTTGGTSWDVYRANGVSVTTSTIATGTWYHVALVRNSGVTRLYVNGTQIGSDASDTTNYTGGNLCVGGYYSTAYLLSGYIDDFRITKGVARYTANFTAPTAAFPDL